MENNVKGKLVGAKKTKAFKGKIAPASRPALGISPKPEVQNRKTSRKIQMF